MNVTFLNQLVVRKSNGDWVVQSDFGARIDGRTVIVLAGFKTDFASVPRLPLAYLLAGNTAHKSAVLHDWLYTKGADRQFADQAFLAAMKAEGISGWRRWLMYSAVRAFGWSVYKRREGATEARLDDDAKELGGP